MTVTAVRGSLGWLGPGRMVESPLVVMEHGVIVYAGPSRGVRGVVASGEHGAEDLAGRPAVPEADEEIDVDGFVMPAVADRHVHIGLADPAAVLAGGVTAVRDLGWRPGEVFPLAAASESPTFDGPLIRAAGPMITAPGGYPTRAGWAPQGVGREVTGPEEAAGAVAELAEAGASTIKVALNAEAGPMPTDEELVAVCDAAHAAQLPVTAHCQGRGQVARALGAGVDELAHCPWSERLSDDVIEALARRARIVSTLDIQSYGQDTPELRVALENLARFLQAGGRVAYGTDLGNGPIPPGIHVTEAWHLRRAGLSAEQVLEAMAFRPLAPGEPADLVVLKGNPLEDLNALGRIVLVVRAGHAMR